MSIDKRSTASPSSTTASASKYGKKTTGEPKGLRVMEAMVTPYAPLNDSADFWLIAQQLRKSTESERLRNIQAGFSSVWVRAVRETFKLSNALLEALFNASMSTLERRQRDGQPLDPVTSERLDRVAMIAMQAVNVFETPELASRWMVTGNMALGDQTPLHLCETEIGARQVRRALAALEYGGVV
jgi:putative toxin-antitoxin system antitoxin component (TIGR02293 family)